MATLLLPPEASAEAVPPLASIATLTSSPRTSPTDTDPPLALALATPPLPALASPPVVTLLPVRGPLAGRCSSVMTKAQMSAGGSVIVCTAGAPGAPNALQSQIVWYLGAS